MAGTDGHADGPVAPHTTRPLALSLLKLARPKQWSKSVFVLIGPVYGLGDMLQGGERDVWMVMAEAIVAAVAFALTSSGCYIINDIQDREADRLHPRKRNRPIASGAVSVPLAITAAVALFVAAASLLLLLAPQARPWVALTLGLYIANVVTYSFYLKQKVIGDVIGLSVGFVLRVMGGCAAVSIMPSTWLLNVTFFLSMFLAFGKRLGERRTMRNAPDGDGVAHRAVQKLYTDVHLQMAVVVTMVATLMTYAAYVQTQDDRYTAGFNLLWLTLLPATYGLLRCIVLLEAGRYDDPTEMAFKDRGFIAAAIAFAVITLGAMYLASGGSG
jgi:decaprenyl-phosphate phosphoribosyltransferase